MSTNRTQLTEDAIKKIVDGMPGGIDSFCTDWGWLQFARKIEAAHGITQQTTMPAPPTIKAGQRLLIKKPYPINPYEVHVLETAGEYAKIQGDSDQRGFWEKIELITPYVIHVL